MDLSVGPEIRLLLFSRSLVCDSLGPPWTAARQASLSFIITQSLLYLMSIKSVMPSNNLILLTLSFPALSLCQHQTLFQWVNSSQWVFKILKLQLQHQPFQWIFRVDVFRIDWFNLLAVQGTLIHSYFGVWFIFPSRCKYFNVRNSIFFSVILS